VEGNRLHCHESTEITSDWKYVQIMINANDPGRYSSYDLYRPSNPIGIKVESCKSNFQCSAG